MASVRDRSEAKKELAITQYIFKKNELDLICPDDKGGWKFNEEYEGYAKGYPEIIKKHQDKSPDSLNEALKQLPVDDSSKKEKKVLLALIVLKEPKSHAAMSAFLALAEMSYESAGDAQGKNKRRKLLPLFLYSEAAVKLSGLLRINNLNIVNPITALVHENRHIIFDENHNIVARVFAVKFSSVKEFQKILARIFNDANRAISMPLLSAGLKEDFASFHGSKKTVDVKEDITAVDKNKSHLVKQVIEIITTEDSFHTNMTIAISLLKRLSQHKYPVIELMMLYQGLIINPLQEVVVQDDNIDATLADVMRHLSSRVGILNMSLIKLATAYQPKAHAKLESFRSALEEDDNFCDQLRSHSEYLSNVSESSTNQFVVNAYITALNDLFIQPPQRAGRYPLLFKEVSKYTPSKDVTLFLKLVTAFTTEVNAQTATQVALLKSSSDMQEAESMQLISDITDSMGNAYTEQVKVLQANQQRISEEKHVAQKKADDAEQSKKLVEKKLKGYTRFKLDLFSHHHNKDAKELKDQLKEVKSIEEVKKILEAEHNRLVDAAFKNNCNPEESGYYQSVKGALLAQLQDSGNNTLTPRR